MSNRLRYCWVRAGNVCHLVMKHKLKFCVDSETTDWPTPIYAVVPDEHLATTVTHAPRVLGLHRPICLCLALSFFFFPSKGVKDLKFMNFQLKSYFILVIE